MFKEAKLLFVIVEFYAISCSITELCAQGLCQDGLSKRTSTLCQEFQQMSRDGVLLNCHEHSSKLSCRSRCHDALQRRNVSECYCDKLCPLIGDCCIDFSLRCQASENVETRNVGYCAAFQNGKLKGYIAKSSCSTAWRGKKVRELCLQPNASDPLNRIPVYDHDTGTTFSSVYCAVCSWSKNFSYWNLEFEFRNLTQKDKASGASISSLMLKHNWIPQPYPPNSTEHCIPNTFELSADADESIKNVSSVVWSLCKAYSMPVYEPYGSAVFKNPHCGSLLHTVPPILTCLKQFPSVGPRLIQSIPLLVYSMLFTLGPKATHSCKATHFFDPLKNRCRKILTSQNGQSVRLQNSSMCSNGNIYKPSEFFVVSNGSVYILAQNKMYSDKKYTKTNEGILLCDNNTSSKRDFVSNRRHSNLPSLILTFVGSIISITSLLCFLVTRLMFSELRSLFGKNLMSLSFAMLMFQILFLLTGLTGNITVCDAVTGGLHYASLAMFAWMSVIAYDVSKTFTAKALGSASADIERGKETKQFSCYCLYAWGMPLTMMITCVVLGVTGDIDTGYGTNGQRPYCYLTPAGRIYCSIPPIAVVLLFNLVALIRTVIAIREVKRGTQGVIGYYAQPNFTILCLKLTSVMGLAWMLGFVYIIGRNPFVEYLHMTVNSLQGFLLFIFFGCNKRILDLYRNKFCLRKKTLTAVQSGPRGRNSAQGSLETIL